MSLADEKPQFWPTFLAFLTAIPTGTTVRGAVMALHADESGDILDVYARAAATEWKKDEPPECDPGGEVAGQATGDQWTWDVTSLLQAQRDAGAKDLVLCLVLKRNGSVVFASREGSPSNAPSLTITYR